MRDWMSHASLLTHHCSYFFLASHFPCIWPAKSNSPLSFPSFSVAVIAIAPFGVSRVKLSLLAAKVPLLNGAEPCAESEEPVTLSPSSLSLRVKGNCVPAASATASQSPVIGSPAAGAASVFPAPAGAEATPARFSSTAPPCPASSHLP